MSRLFQQNRLKSLVCRFRLDHACRLIIRIKSKFDLWPYKCRTNEGSITKIKSFVECSEIHLSTKLDQNGLKFQVFRAIPRFPKIVDDGQRFDLWPYKSQTNEGRVKQIARRLEYSTSHLCTKLEQNRLIFEVCRVDEISQNCRQQTEL